MDSTFKNILMDSNIEKYKEFEKKKFNDEQFNNWNSQNNFKKMSQTIKLKNKKTEIEQ